MMPKFRAWDVHSKKKMAVVKAWSEFNGGEVTIKRSGEYGSYVVPIDHVILMQSTGLFDKNGVEIFEGDVVEWATISGRKRGVGKIKHGGHVFLISSGKKVDHMNGSYSYNLLGNIHEHPDLVEATP